MYVEGPVGAFTELTVTDNIDSDISLLANDLLDRLLKSRVINFLTRRIVATGGAQHPQKVVGPNEASDMRRQYAIGHLDAPQIAFTPAQTAQVFPSGRSLLARPTFRATKLPRKTRPRTREAAEYPTCSPP